MEVHGLPGKIRRSGIHLNAGGSDAATPGRRPAGPSPRIQRKFDAKKKKSFQASLKEIGFKLEDLGHNLEEPVGEEDRRTHRDDTALGVTEVKERTLPPKWVGYLDEIIADAEGDGEEQEILDRALKLKARTTVGTNLRIFGDKMGASTWMDWELEEGAARVETYREQFTRLETNPILAGDGRFKFNLSGLNAADTRTGIKEAAEVSRAEIDRWVSLGPEALSKTSWELLEILSTPELRAKTDFLVFDKVKNKDEIPKEATADELKKYGVDEALELLTDEAFARLQDDDSESK